MTVEFDSPTRSPHEASAAERRRIDKLRRKVLTWWDALPDAQREPRYHLAQLAKSTGLPVTTLGPVLRGLGWTREEVRLSGVQHAVWIPPGQPSQKKPAGRPRLIPIC